jgi:uncharacterized membrane protein
VRPHPFTILVALGAVIGFAFATVSTYDFMVHLDRQLHGIHCSYFPGLGETDTAGMSGCHATLMSPYSSVLRDRLWGGLPVSLPGMSVFAFLLFLAVDLMITRRQADLRAVGLLVLVATVPVVTSVAMGYLSVARLGVFCKSCVGIYTGSGVVFVGALALWIRAAMRRRAAAREGGVAGDEPRFVAEAGGQASLADTMPDGGAPLADTVPSGAPAGMQGRAAGGKKAPPGQLSWLRALAFCGLGVVFVALPIGLYFAVAPSFDHYVGSCGNLEHGEDPNRVLVSLGGEGAASVEVLDPLCTACKALETRLQASGLAGRMHRQALVFPLDSECNWMVERSIHPGACAMAEALLCAGDDAGEVLEWTFAEQERILTTARGAEGSAGARRMVTERFPELGRCMGTAEVRARLNLALRWAVRNQLPVSAPQLYVDGRKLCDEDTDLGLEYMLPRLMGGSGTRAQRDARGPETAGDAVASRAAGEEVAR